MSVQAVLEEKWMLEKQIEAVQLELRGLPDIGAIEGRLSGDKWRLADYRARYPGNPSSYTRDIQEYFKQVEERIHLNEREANKLNARKNELKARLARLEKQLGALDFNFSAEEVGEIRADWLRLEERLKVSQGALSAMENETKTSQQILDELNSLKVRHEDLLADVALGVEGADKEIEAIKGLLPGLQARYEVERGKGLEQEKTVAGLRRKVEEVEALLPDAKERYRAALAKFVQNEMDQAGSEYVELAKQFSESFLRVVALASICEDLGETVRIFGPRTAQFNIPAFRIKPCMEFINT